MRYHVIKGCGEIASGESVALVLKKKYINGRSGCDFHFSAVGGRLENVPLVMDWVKPCDMAASVIETIHYRFHNSHFLSSLRAPTVAAMQSGLGAGWVSSPICIHICRFILNMCFFFFRFRQQPGLFHTLNLCLFHLHLSHPMSARWTSVLTKHPETLSDDGPC